MDNWLVKRVTKSRQGSSVWVELAEVIQEYWDTHLTADIEQLDNAKSLFSSSPEDLNRRIEELGDFFDVFLPIAESSKPLAIAWRTREIHDKDSLAVVNSILERNFPKLNARWEVLYLKPDQNYSLENLVSHTEITQSGFDPDNYVMTSRGRLWVDYRQMQSVYPSLTRKEFKELVQSEIAKIKPTHIVYDGEMFLLMIDWRHKLLPFTTGRNQTNQTVMTHDLKSYSRVKDSTKKSDFAHIAVQPAEHLCFDEIPSDYTPLDLRYGTINE